jgi:uncharacterized protein (UPF0333 family)
MQKRARRTGEAGQASSEFVMILMVGVILCVIGTYLVNKNFAEASLGVLKEVLLIQTKILRLPI